MAGQEPASAVYLTDDANVAETLLDKAIAGYGADDVEEDPLARHYRLRVLLHAGGVT